MRKIVYAFLLVLLALTIPVYRAVTARTVRVAAAETRRADEATSASVRWEYCAVTRAVYTATNRRGTYWINYFKETGIEVVGVEEGAFDQDSAAARVMAKLGEEGWEMVGQGGLPVKSGGVDAIYFKRRKQ
jgi:hypothetical protein